MLYDKFFLVSKMLLIQAHNKLPVDVFQLLLTNFVHWCCCLKLNDNNALNALGTFEKAEESFGSLEMKDFFLFF